MVPADHLSLRVIEPANMWNHDARLSSQLTAIIKTFERPSCLDRLICSMQHYYPDLRIVVGDDSYRPQPRDDVEYCRFEPDIGNSAGRNRLLGKVTTPYFLLLDDDLEFTAETRIETLLQLVAEGVVDLAAGDYIGCQRRLVFFTRQRRQPYHGVFALRGRHLLLQRGYLRRRRSYLICDFVHPFFVARTAAIRAMGGWDEELRKSEHEDFFLRFGQQGFKAAVVPSVTARQWNRETFTQRWRNRKQAYFPHVLLKHGLDACTLPDGRVERLDIA